MEELLQVIVFGTTFSGYWFCSVEDALNWGFSGVCCVGLVSLGFTTHATLCRFMTN